MISPHDFCINSNCIAYKVYWFSGSPVPTMPCGPAAESETLPPVPQITLVPQMTLLPWTEEVPHTTEPPQITEAPQITEPPQITELPEMFCMDTVPSAFRTATGESAVPFTVSVFARA